ncbi:hypothetical protein Ami103574_07360 [Aminipila butyrica]|uniref:CobQ/CobB/MinD/ParA nucleotide binding domain-containing protein n=1 Tax=Aminipila butyrica TaxID=433296 RepID=A0A858BVD9_9FIRM|nr:hypothetical protein [Aminipila butyrica]QIB69149.1 hypothetical protein Ami103574_07360 [Aminipila butyrica]
MKRIFVREEGEDEYRVVKNRFKIGVTGMGQGVGTSLVATALAKELAREKKTYVAYVEINQEGKSPLLYDSLGIDKRFAGRRFLDFYEETAKGHSLAGLVNLDERINWALWIPEDGSRNKRRPLEVIELCRLINNIAGDHIVCDINPDPNQEQLLREMDCLIFVIDPLPSRLIGEYEKLCLMKKYQLKGQKVFWVVNKYNEGINKREFTDFVKIKPFLKIPLIPQEDLYLAEYNCRLAYSLPSVNERIGEPIRQLLQLCKKEL